eukprot:g17901.t1
MRSELTLRVTLNLAPTLVRRVRCQLPVADLKFDCNTDQKSLRLPTIGASSSLVSVLLQLSTWGLVPFGGSDKLSRYYTDQNLTPSLDCRCIELSDLLIC